MGRAGGRPPFAILTDYALGMANWTTRYADQGSEWDSQTTGDPVLVIWLVALVTYAVGFDQNPR